MGKLLTAMYATSKSEKPFTFKDLASCYFHGERGEGVYLMQMELVKNAKESMRGQMKDWLVNDLKG